MWRRDARFLEMVAHWEVLPSRPASLVELPEQLPEPLRRGLVRRGILRLYRHQAEALATALRGEHVVVVTPTSSGKSLAYTLPVLSRILTEPEARALYLFPTKALGQDQVAFLLALAKDMGVSLRAYTYDGDTPPAARVSIRNAGQIVVTNPDMLHTGILPHHPRWVKLFQHLRYVVVDELHTYRGVFGSHVANVFRRLQRICQHYGSRPVFLAASATIANPGELAETLLASPVRVVDENGAPQGERHLILLNPPVVHESLGIRRSSTLVARDVAEQLLRAGIPTIVFGRTRVQVEVLLRYLQERLGPRVVQGYRGGYLPEERRAVERGLREGTLLGVVSTNALELGVDIGHLDASVIVGFPGSVASLWQQAGRAGRRGHVSASILVAASSPLDQYLCQHPEYLLGASPEAAHLNPENLPILLGHLQCAAFELPFREDERFGTETTGEILSALAERRILRRTGGRYYWTADAFPAEDISLRAASTDNVVIVDVTERPRVLGEVDRFSARTLVHEQAIYLHQGQQYHVDRLDLKENRAYVRAVDVDYYTDANLAVSLQVLSVDQQEGEPLTRSLGTVRVTALATVFKKIRMHTHEVIGSGRIHLPEEELQTTAYWLSFPEEAAATLSSAELEAALAGLGYLLGHLAPLYALCDPRDLGLSVQVRSPFTGRPTLFLYDVYPGGTGLADHLYRLHHRLLAASLERLSTCPCTDGCPSCSGPSLAGGHKALTRRLLDTLQVAARAHPGGGEA